MTGPSQQLQDLVEQYEARDLDKRNGTFRGVRSGTATNVPPNPRRRRCNNCEMDVELNDAWECPTPGCCRWDGRPTQVFWTTEKIDCDQCGRPAFRQWKMNVPGEIDCQCKESPEQKRAREDRERQERFKAAKFENELKIARQARSCWQDMNYECKLQKLPYDFCRRACARFDEGRKLQTQLRRHEQGRLPE